MQDVRTLTEIITAGMAVFGFLGLILQLKNLERELRGAARNSLYDMGARLKDLFVKHPEQRKYFLDGEPIGQDSEDYPQALAIADFFCLYLEQITTQAPYIGRKHRKPWMKYAVEIYRKSPLIQEYLQDKRSWYVDDFWKAVEKAESKS